MGVPTSEVSYTSATTGRGDHKGHVVALEEENKKEKLQIAYSYITFQIEESVILPQLVHGSQIKLKSRNNCKVGVFKLN
jgi:hypothetical protein